MMREPVTRLNTPEELAARLDEMDSVMCFTSLNNTYKFSAHNILVREYRRRPTVPAGRLVGWQRAWIYQISYPLRATPVPVPVVYNTDLSSGSIVDILIVEVFSV